MLVNFFHGLKDAGVPVTTRELLDLLLAMRRNLAFADIDAFYNLSRAVMVKDEKYYDRFDRAFGLHFRELENLVERLAKVRSFCLMGDLNCDDLLQQAFETIFNAASELHGVRCTASCTASCTAGCTGVRAEPGRAAERILVGQQRAERVPRFSAKLRQRVVLRTSFRDENFLSKPFGES